MCRFKQDVVEGRIVHRAARGGLRVRPTNIAMQEYSEIHEEISIPDDKVHDAGDFDDVCVHCSANFMQNEHTSRPCCLNGRIQLPEPEQILPLMRRLLTDQN